MSAPWNVLYRTRFLNSNPWQLSTLSNETNFSNFGFGQFRRIRMSALHQLMKMECQTFVQIDQQRIQFRGFLKSSLHPQSIFSSCSVFFLLRSDQSDVCLKVSTNVSMSINNINLSEQLCPIISHQTIMKQLISYISLATVQKRFRPPWHRNRKPIQKSDMYGTRQMNTVVFFVGDSQDIISAGVM